MENTDSAAIVEGLETRAAAVRAGESPDGLTSRDLGSAGAELLLGKLLTESFDPTVLSARESRRILEVSGSFCRLTGYSRSELIGRTSIEVGLVVADQVGDHILARADRGIEGLYTRELRHQDGHRLPVELSQTLLLDHGLVLTRLRDVAEQHQKEQARERLAAIVHASVDAIIGVTADGVIDAWNRGAERLYGYRLEDAVGLPVDRLSHPGERARRREILARVLAGGSAEQIETRDQCRDGAVIDVSITDSPIHDARRQVVGVARVVHDITERKHRELDLKFRADHDPLTGLLNRGRFNEELVQSIAHAARYNDTTALLLADIDSLKAVNDTLGHQAGDELIKRVARTLAGRLRTTDVLARIGGDEFAVLLPRTDLTHALLVAESLRQAVHDNQLALANRTLRATLSIGATAFDASQLTPDDALMVADVAMYQAKQQGRNRVATARQDPQREGFDAILSWPRRLRNAVLERRFELHAQPIIKLDTSAIAGYELLVRMRDDGALVSPAAFMLAAERQGLVSEIDRWVLDEALAAIGAHPDPALTFAINLGLSSIADPDFLRRLEAGLTTSDLDPARLVIEISEAAAVGDIDAAVRFVARAHRAGCAVALDDFGSRFGSFNCLEHLPIDYLKIDGDLIRTLPTTPTNQLLVRAIADIARGLGVRTIAEHVECGETIVLLRGCEIDYAQGFHVGRPMPLATILQPSQARHQGGGAEAQIPAGQRPDPARPEP